jgi:hypothetical protein
MAERRTIARDTAQVIATASSWACSLFVAFVLSGQPWSNAGTHDMMDPRMAVDSSQCLGPTTSTAAAALGHGDSTSMSPDSIRLWQMLKASRIPWPLAHDLDSQVALEKCQIFFLEGMTATKLGCHIFDARTRTDPGSCAL